MYSDTPRHLAGRYRCVYSNWTLQTDFRQWSSFGHAFEEHPVRMDEAVSVPHNVLPRVEHEANASELNAWLLGGAQ